MNPYTIYYTDDKQKEFSNVWDADTLQDAIENAIYDLQNNHHNNFTVLINKTMQLVENQY